jgi:hypothetical protein
MLFNEFNGYILSLKINFIWISNKNQIYFFFDNGEGYSPKYFFISYTIDIIFFSYYRICKQYFFLHNYKRK